MAAQTRAPDSMPENERVALGQTHARESNCEKMRFSSSFLLQRLLESAKVCGYIVKIRRMVWGREVCKTRIRILWLQVKAFLFLNPFWHFRKKSRSPLTNSLVKEIENVGQLGPAKLVFGFGNDVVDSPRSQAFQGVRGFDGKLRRSRRNWDENCFPVARGLVNMLPLGNRKALRGNWVRLSL